MVSERDIYASAQLLINQHGSNAENVAEARLHCLMKQDDVKGASVWLAIMNAINDLTIKKRQTHLH